MKTITTFGFAAIALGLASLATPASATTPVPAGIAQTSTDISAARHFKRRTVIRRGPVCTVRKVVRRGPFGRRVVTKTRICR